MKYGRRIAAGALILVGACGSAGSGVSTTAGALLQHRVDAIRAAAARGDRRTTAAELSQLRTGVARLRANGSVSDEAATRILDAAKSVENELSLLPEPTTTTTTTTTTSTTAPPPDNPGQGKGHDQKHGHGRHGGDEG